MELSFFLAQALGLYFLLISIILVFKRNIIQKVITHLRRNRLTVYLLASIELAIGLSIFSAHRIWTGWPLLLTLIAIGLVLEALFYFIVPLRTIERVNRRFVKSPWYYVALLSTFVIGAILILKGYQIW